MNSPTLTIDEFLLARVADDEATLDAGPSRRWHAPDCSWCDGVTPRLACDCEANSRVPAECRAKRDLVRLHGGCEDGDSACETLQILARPYAEHADFDPRWGLPPNTG